MAFIRDLPYETLIKIFETLADFQNLHDIKSHPRRISRYCLASFAVCRTWRNIIISSRKLWEVALEFSPKEKAKLLELANVYTQWLADFNDCNIVVAWRIGRHATAEDYPGFQAIVNAAVPYFLHWHSFEAVLDPPSIEILLEALSIRPTGPCRIVNFALLSNWKFRVVEPIRLPIHFRNVTGRMTTENVPILMGNGFVLERVNRVWLDIGLRSWNDLSSTFLDTRGLSELQLNIISSPEFRSPAQKIQMSSLEDLHIILPCNRIPMVLNQFGLASLKRLRISISEEKPIRSIEELDTIDGPYEMQSLEKLEFTARYARPPGWDISSVSVLLTKISAPRLIEVNILLCPIAKASNLPIMMAQPNRPQQSVPGIANSYAKALRVEFGRAPEDPNCVQYECLPITMPNIMRFELSATLSSPLLISILADRSFSTLHYLILSFPFPLFPWFDSEQCIMLPQLTVLLIRTAKASLISTHFRLIKAMSLPQLKKFELESYTGSHSVDMGAWLQFASLCSSLLAQVEILSVKSLSWNDVGLQKHIYLPKLRRLRLGWCQIGFLASLHETISNLDSVPARDLALKALRFPALEDLDLDPCPCEPEGYKGPSQKEELEHLLESYQIAGKPLRRLFSDGLWKTYEAEDFKRVSSKVDELHIAKGHPYITRSPLRKELFDRYEGWNS